ncbi:MAG: ABC transporter substrate-binding protein [Pseudomonadota bacterium]|jgi:peptide/nickel transport system substrate-binding protein|nr:ABC transporter substrate-binding protein [Pseudomonadota bacterium]|tara:strand:- start:173 stop:1681 length:1509 start_codon:yes stop_codon:yes gene_type:complete
MRTEKKILKTKSLLILFVLLSQFFINSCKDIDRNTIAIGLNTNPITLDPRYATDAISYRLIRLLYKSLIDFDEEFHAKPELADWEKISPIHYRFTLREKLNEFHDGSLLTSEDVKATYESVLNPEKISPHRSSIAMIESIEVVGRNIIDFKLLYPDPLFPGRLVIGILPKKLISKKHNFAREPIGNGPMKIVDFKNDNHLKLLRLHDNKIIEFITLKDPTVRVLKLLKGEIDLIQGNLPPEIIAWLDQKKSIHVKKKIGNTFTYLGFNMEDPIVGNILIRNAIAHAIDRESIIKYVMGASARKAEALLPPEHWAGNSNLTGFDYNPEKSRILIKQAGYSDSYPIRLVYKTSNDPFRLRLATIIQHQLDSVGIEVEIRSYDWGTFYGDIKEGRFQMYSLSWVGLKVPDIFHYIFHSKSIPPYGANRGRFKDKNVDSILELAKSEVLLYKQALYYKDLQEYLLQALPYIPLWYEDNVLVSKSNIKGYTLSTDGNFDSLEYVTKK